MNRHLRSGSRTNRDRRDQAFARSVIATATKMHQEATGDLAFRKLGGEIEVCPDCMGSRETEQHVTDDITRMLPCPECNGKGYYQKEQ
jgi:DnaJ-class molecular chaperone